VNQRTITVSFSHIETTKILIPALEALLLRVHELVQDAADEPPYARWVRDTSYDLLAALRQQLSAVRWGEGLLRIELDPDRVGLLAAALGGLRRRMDTTDREGTASALTVTRQRLWLTIPFEFPLAWWLSHDVVQGELLPLLRASYARTDDASERSHAERILRSTERVLSLSDSEALRLETALADLAWLATAAERTPSARRLHGLLEHLLDPLVQERYRTYRSGQRERVTGQSHATFTPPSGDGPASHSRSRAEADTAARPPSATAAPGQPGSVWRRLAAAMLDGIVFWVFSALLGALVSVLFVGESPGLVVLPPRRLRCAQLADRIGAQDRRPLCLLGVSGRAVGRDVGQASLRSHGRRSTRCAPGAGQGTRPSAARDPSRLARSLALVAGPLPDRSPWSARLGHGRVGHR
jgi:hypothetical protein